MNPEIKVAFSRIKPICDAVMACPSSHTIRELLSRIAELKNDTIQEMQLYILFPVVAHLKSKELRSKYELQRSLVITLYRVLKKVTVESPEVFIKYHTCLLNLVFDKSQTGMVARVPEELKLGVMECLTTLMLSTTPTARLKIFQTQVPLLAHTIFVAVHMAKLDKLRSLRLSSITCLTAYMGVHDALTSSQKRNLSEQLEAAAEDMAASILPGVVAALQDVATDVDNPGHAIVVAALNATHRIVCQVMSDKHLKQKDDVSLEDFSKMLKDRVKLKSKKYVEKKAKGIPKNSPEWFSMAGDKLQLVCKSLSVLQTHEHMLVRQELAVLYGRVLEECTRTMQPSMPCVLDVLISLSKDEYPEVSVYCTEQLNLFFHNISDEARNKTLDSLSDNFTATLTTLPRIMNNIDSNRKLCSLNLLHGYVTLLCAGRPPRFTSLIAGQRTRLTFCRALLEVCRLSTDGALLRLIATRDVTAPVPTSSPWCKLKHIDDRQSETRLQEICQLLGNAECADLIVDQLLDLFEDSLDDRKEIIYLLTRIGSASNPDLALTKRILNKYIEHNIWYLPLEVSPPETAISIDETLDVSVYNPRAWDKDSVPGLYEGATETRYTDISYATPRLARVCPPGFCPTLGHANCNMVQSCLLTEGLGVLARRLGDYFQPYLLKTLCMVLERVGSKYEMLHLAGLRAVTDVATACLLESVPLLIQHNADYLTYHLTTSLKKTWNSHSALEILTVVMEYSDSSILNCLYGIVSDVLVRSCDNCHESHMHTRDLSAYLQVFLTFVNCIQKWFPTKTPEPVQEPNIQGNVDLMQDAIDYINAEEESEKLLSAAEFEQEMGKTAEEMYKEDLMRKEEEDCLNYDDTVTQEKPPVPQHIEITVTILKRSLNYISSKRREEKLLALQIINQGLPIIREHEDELLPLVHQVWGPLVVRFEEINEPVVLRRAFEVLVTMAALSKDFIMHRTVKEVLPNLNKFLLKASLDSHLKDVGSAYRASHAYQLQLAGLQAAPGLVQHLGLTACALEGTMAAVEPYLSNRQPKPLQALAVSFFRAMLQYEQGAAWLHLRRLCANQAVLKPTALPTMRRETIVGTPFEPTDSCYASNVQAIFTNVL